MPYRRLVLALDTTGSACSVTLADQASTLSHKSHNIGRGHAEYLAPLVQNVLKDANTHPSQLNRVVVCNGPGSFTGLRVSLSFAKGLALPLKIPVLGLSGLQVMAAHADPKRVKSVLAISDVRRNEVSWQVFKKGIAQDKPATDKLDVFSNNWLDLNVDGIVGDGAKLIGQETAITQISTPIMAWLALDLDPQLFPATALYSRAPDAKLPKKV